MYFCYGHAGKVARRAPQARFLVVSGAFSGFLGLLWGSSSSSEAFRGLFFFNPFHGFGLLNPF